MHSIKFKISDYGKQIIFHPFEVYFSHFYQQCINNDVSYYGSLLISSISQENYTFLTSPKLIGKQSDILYLVEIFEQYLDSGDKHNFCISRNLPIKGMEMAERIFKTLNKSGKGSLETLERVFSNCFSHNLCERVKDGSYQMRRTGLSLYIHPTSGFFKRNDQKIVVVDIFHNVKLYGRIVGKFYD